MDPELYALISQLQPVATERAMWGSADLKVDYYITDQLPPDSLISGARAVMLRGDHVLVIREKETLYHIMPGGGRWPGEAVQATLRRELVEETGWTPVRPLLFGFRHGRVLSARETWSDWPYPDFCQPYFVAQPGEYLPDQRLGPAELRQEFVLESTWLPFEEALQLPMNESQYALLQAALRSR